ncbi:MAG TPA: antitoxin family protein [Blastocatellia bacterium]|nr:antitoxin family protein [Blastocatellia bacterium]
MSHTIKAVYHNGAFIPQEPCDLPEGVQVEVVVSDPYTIPPQITDPKEREKVMAELLKRMSENPIPENAPRFTRDELHERR